MKEKFGQILVRVLEILEESNCSTSENRLKMGDRAEGFKKPGMGGVWQVPDDLYCSVP